jgi:TrmH family RNA methyltransferase
VRELFIAESLADPADDLLAQAAQRAVPVTVVGDRVVSALAETQTPQGVFAVVDVPTSDGRESLNDARLVAALVGVADPGNVGTIIRTADAAGADAVVLTSGCADPYGGKAVRASAGSILRVPVVTDVPIGDVVGLLRRCGLTILAATGGGAELDRRAARSTDRMAWLFGSEAHGLPAEVEADADRRVRVPMRAGVESINVTAAAAVCLYATVLP